MSYTKAMTSALLVLGALFTSSAQAISYQVSIDTSLLSGTAAQLALDFIDGGPPANSAAVSGFATDGTLGTQVSSGDVTGNLPVTVTLADTQFFNELLADITLGTSLSFIFTPTTNGPDVGSLPDSFSAFLLDPLSGLPLFATTHPSGADALFQFDIDGTETGMLSVFAALNDEVGISVAPISQQVPEPGTVALLAIGLAGVCVLRRRIKQATSSFATVE